MLSLNDPTIDVSPSSQDYSKPTTLPDPLHPTITPRDGTMRAYPRQHHVQQQQHQRKHKQPTAYINQAGSTRKPKACAQQAQTMHTSAGMRQQGENRGNPIADLSRALVTRKGGERETSRGAKNVEYSEKK